MNSALLYFVKRPKVTEVTFKQTSLTFLPKFSGEDLGSTWSRAKMTQILIKCELQSPEHQLRGRDPGLSHEELWLDLRFPPKAEAPPVGDGGVQK